MQFGAFLNGARGFSAVINSGDIHWIDGKDAQAILPRADLLDQGGVHVADQLTAVGSLGCAARRYPVGEAQRAVGRIAQPDARHRRGFGQAKVIDDFLAFAGDVLVNLIEFNLSPIAVFADGDFLAIEAHLAVVNSSPGGFGLISRPGGAYCPHNSRALAFGDGLVEEIFVELGGFAGLGGEGEDVADFTGGRRVGGDI